MHTYTYLHRDKTIRLFFSGDYEFLTAIYGLSGASGKILFGNPTSSMTINWCIGKHNCSNDLKIPLDTRGRQTPRTLSSIKADYTKFAEAGGNLRLAKEYNNAIRKPLFDIPLDHVRQA